MPKTARHALLNVIVMIAAFAGLELLARLAFRAGNATHTRQPEVMYPYHPYLGWDNAPNFSFKGDLARGLHHWAVETDSQGHSITPHLNYTDPEVDIAIVGGSAAFGVGASGNAATVPSLVERELHRRTGLRVEVHNLAVGGYTSFQEMLSLERYMATRRVDLAVALSGYNDAYAAAFASGPDFGLLLERVNPKADLVRSIERGDLAAVPVAMNMVLSRLRRASYAIDLLGKVSDRLQGPDQRERPGGKAAPPDQEIARRARWVMTNYAMVDALAKQNGAQFFMFLQPTSVTKKSLTTEESQSLDSLDQAIIQRLFPVEKVFYAAVRACDKRFAFFDLSPCLDDASGPAFADDVHYLDGAAGVVANAICDVITPAVVEVARRRGVKIERAIPPER